MIPLFTLYLHGKSGVYSKDKKGVTGDEEMYDYNVLVSIPLRSFSTTDL